MMSLYNSLEELPLGTKLISHANPETIGEVVRHGETRGMEEVEIHWSNGAVSLVWIHQLTNLKYQGSP